ncbi:DUF6415 family natural product biosynthesis protein [Streptomyces sp. WAC 06783]|uniref:DUF6415 family natural product biosynthesis protein n=1 Tax=Streptomyces sp. WAC 06783 TaxID=2203211 RepID=UPI000F7399D0|nr:DUF6415 family natural product biosynthesis protein [Streptomyces sp. WAC 06783]
MSPSAENPPNEPSPAARCFRAVRADQKLSEIPVDVSAIQRTIARALAPYTDIPPAETARQVWQDLAGHIHLLAPEVEQRARGPWAGTDQGSITLSGIACVRGKLRRGLPGNDPLAAWAAAQELARQCQILLGLATDPLVSEPKR